MGVDAFVVEIEASTIRGQQQSISIIGLPDQAIKEAGERIQAAIESCGYDIPKDKTIISLAPGDKKKREDKRVTISRVNRIIAALSDVLYVIDAGRNSGTVSTVENAKKYFRKVEMF